MTLTIDERRESIFAAVLRYLPETGSLRDRIIDRLILFALLDSTESQPLDIDQIQKNVFLGSGSIRTELIEKSLDRLSDKKKILVKKVGKGTALYFHSSEGEREVTEVAISANDLFEPVIDKMLKNSSLTLTREYAEYICRKFLTECFNEFGQQIARCVTGSIERQELLSSINARAILNRAAAHFDLSSSDLDSLRSRCASFLHSTDPLDEELKFRLTQGYYVARLLDLNPSQFNPLLEDAFSGTIFYLDTNVLITRLLSKDIAELAKITQALRIELRVTTSTIDETMGVTVGRLGDFEAVVNALPRELAEKTRDQILQAYFSECKSRPRLTPEAFLHQFNNIPSILQSLDITVDDQTQDEMLNGHDSSKVCHAIDEAAIQTRGFGKSDAVQRHDAAHYFLIEELRSRGEKVWFMTRDRTLSAAAATLIRAKNGIPFCYPFVGFLQGVSPFVENADSKSIIDLFAFSIDNNFNDGLASTTTLFDLDELKIISELHEDVLSTAPDKLVLAFDYIKTRILQGHPYRLEDHNEVSLELKKYLTSNKDETQRTLEGEVVRQQFIIDEQDRASAQQKEAADALENDLQKHKLNLQIATDQTTKIERRNRILASYLYLLCLLLVSVLWKFDLELAMVLIANHLAVIDQQSSLQAIIRSAGALGFVGVAYLLSLPFKKNTRIGIFVIVAFLALSSTYVFDNQQISNFSSSFSLVSGLTLLLFSGRPSKDQ